jgi:hypothetical protein
MGIPRPVGDFVARGKKENAICHSLKCREKNFENTKTEHGGHVFPFVCRADNDLNQVRVVIELFYMTRGNKLEF